MKGFIAQTLVLLGSTVALTGVGCYHYDDLVDPCYPERYNHAARQEVNGAFAPQVQNGHVLDQTVWNYHFDYDEAKHVGTDKLTPGGLAHLAYLARRRPCPDPVIYLQTAQDLVYDPAHPDKFVSDRTDLDSRRIQAIQSFLNAQAAGRNVTFQVSIHDPAEPGMSAVPAGLAVTRMYGGSQGNLPSALGAGLSNVLGGGGAAAGAGSGGGGR